MVPSARRFASGSHPLYPGTGPCPSHALTPCFHSQRAARAKQTSCIRQEERQTGEVGRENGIDMIYSRWGGGGEQRGLGIGLQGRRVGHSLGLLGRPISMVKG